MVLEPLPELVELSSKGIGILVSLFFDGERG